MTVQVELLIEDSKEEAGDASSFHVSSAPLLEGLSLPIRREYSKRRRLPSRFSLHVYEYGRDTNTRLLVIQEEKASIDRELFFGLVLYE